MPRTFGIPAFVATTRRSFTRHTLLVLLLAPVTGCDAFLKLSDPGYRQLVNPDRKEIPLRPEWRQFVEAHYLEEAQHYLQGRGLASDTPLVVESVTAEYWRNSRHSELHASLLLPPPPPGRSGTRAIRVTWRKDGDASSRGNDRPWVPDRSDLPKERAWAALRGAADDVYARALELAQTGRYPQLSDFPAAAERIAWGVTFTHNLSPANSPAAGDRPIGPDACHFHVEFRHPTTDFTPGEGVLTFPAVKLAVLFTANATPDHGGHELEAALRQTVTEESAQLAEALAAAERGDGAR